MFRTCMQEYIMQSMNFEFLRPENETLADLAGLAEAVLFIDPGSMRLRTRFNGTPFESA